MWEQYEPRGGEPADQPAGKPADQPAGPPAFSRDEFTSSPIRAGGSSSGVGLAIGLVGMLAVVGIGIGAATSAQRSAESDYSDFYECVADEQADGGGGLLSPADLCEIGHERPPDYVDDDAVWDDGFPDDGFPDDGFLDGDY